MQAEWVLARTKPQLEHIAARHVLRLGETCYLPRYWDGKLKRRTVLFASYLFALIRDRHFGWLSSLPGIASIVHFGEQPAFVPTHVIQSLRMRENSHGNVVLPSQEELAPGDRVKLLVGPFAEQFGIYQGMSTHQRVCVLLTFLNRYTPVYVEREAVERVPETL